MFRVMTEGAKLPAYATDGAAGADLAACLPGGPVTIPPGEFRLIGTGLACEIPPGFEIQIRPRSGLAAKHGVTVLNSPGTIDSDYRGQEVKVILINHGREPFKIAPGDRIAQAVCAQVVRMQLDSGGQRSGGFGSTGK